MGISEDWTLSTLMSSFTLVTEPFSPTMMLLPWFLIKMNMTYHVSGWLIFRNMQESSPKIEIKSIYFYFPPAEPTWLSMATQKISCFLTNMPSPVWLRNTKNIKLRSKLKPQKNKKKRKQRNNWHSCKQIFMQSQNLKIPVQKINRCTSEEIETPLETLSDTAFLLLNQKSARPQGKPKMVASCAMILCNTLRQALHQFRAPRNCQTSCCTSFRGISSKTSRSSNSSSTPSTLMPTSRDTLWFSSCHWVSTAGTSKSKRHWCKKASRNYRERRRNLLLGVRRLNSMRYLHIKISNCRRWRILESRILCVHKIFSGMHWCQWVSRIQRIPINYFIGANPLWKTANGNA